MKLLISIMALSLCVACDTQASKTKEDNPVHKGVQYNGLHERYDRKVLSDLTGVDPVRVEWCAAFVNAVLEESNIESNNDHKYPLTARAFLDWGTTVDVPKSGDVVIFPRGEHAWQGHVGFYIGQEIVNDVLYYIILGGNQSNKVSIATYRASTALGIRRQK